MKKIMMALATVAFAVVAQAGSVNWATVAMFDGSGGASAKVKNTATVYVYLLADEAAYTSLSDVWGTYGADVKTGGANASNAGGTVTGQYTHKASVVTPKDAAPNTTYYAAIIATIGSGDSMKYYAEKASALTGDDGNGSFTTFGLGKLDSAAGAATAWQSAAAPEPTSGMLLLMGLAGLALRRRRA